MPFNESMPASDDYALRQPETVNNSSETFCFFGYDAAIDHAWFVHLQAKPHNWCGRFYIYLPGGQNFLLATCESSERVDERPGAAGLHARCIVPYQHWRVVADLKAAPLTLADMRAGRSAGPATTPIQMSIDVEAVAPLWEIGGDDVTEAQHGNRGFRTHHQQLMQAAGSLVIDGRELAIGGSVWRDHSRGPRTLTTWGTHALMSAWFPQRRCGFGLLRQTTATGARPVNAAYICRDGRLEPAEIVEVSPWRDVDEVRPKVVVTLRAADGYLLHAEGEVITQNLMPIGPAAWLAEGQARWVCDGESAFGICERSCAA